MFRIKALLDIFSFYFSLSGWGRRLIKTLRKNFKKAGVSTSREMMNNALERRHFIRALKTCDKVFLQYVPENLGNSVGRDRWALYARLVPFAWVNQVIRTLLLHAFDVPYDEDGEVRSILYSFGTREWNDLQDIHGVSPKRLLEIMNVEKSSSGNLELLQHILKMQLKALPHDQFPSFYRCWNEANQVVQIGFTKDNVIEMTKFGGRISIQIGLHLFREDIPQALIDFLDSFGLWFYALDSLADLEEDKKIGKIRIFSFVDEPEKELWKMFEAFEEKLRASAQNPDPLLRFTKYLTEQVINNKETLADIEKNIFGLN